MTIVQNTELSPISGSPAKGVKIQIRIGGVPAGTRSSTGTVVAAASLKSDASGHWQADILPNSTLTPPGTWYIVNKTYTAAQGGAKTTQYMVVPASGSPVNFVDCIVSEQDAPRLTESELTDHLAHVDPHDQYLKESDAATTYAPIGSGGGGGASTLDDLTDVIIASPTDAQVVAFETSSGKWKNKPAITSHRLDEFATPAANIPMGSHKITGLSNGVASTDAATVAQLSAQTMKVAVGTANGPPTSGTFQTEQLAISANRRLWVCTVAGTPGTWAPVAPHVTVSPTKPTSPQVGDVHIQPIG